VKKALIVGITGQDGAYLTHLLLSKGYEVHGIRRRVSSFNTSRIDDFLSDPHLPSTRLFLHYGDLTDPTSLFSLVTQIKPDEVYNLGAQSHVAVSFVQPDYTSEVNGLGTLRILEIIKQTNREARFYQASTSELFGSSPAPQDENTPFKPLSPYAVSKQFAFEITKLYREAYNMFACNGILFNHESPIRGETFVTRKVTLGLAKWEAGLKNPIYMGNLDSLRDWGHARDFVEMQWRMLQNETPEDFVIATGRQVSVRQFINRVCEFMDMKLIWEGSGLQEKGIDAHSGKTVFEIDPSHFRPLEVNNLCGDASKASKVLDWQPRTSIDELIEEMVISDRSLIKGSGPIIKWTK
jgi:GDPmannose 4,6-dehydratase